MCTLALIGTALSVGGALIEGQQSRQMADYQVRAYEQQAQADAQAAAFEQGQERHKQDLCCRRRAPGPAPRASPCQAH
jgi:hypothetical protein